MPSEGHAWRNPAGRYPCEPGGGDCGRMVGNPEATFRWGLAAEWLPTMVINTDFGRERDAPKCLPPNWTVYRILQRKTVIKV